MMAWFEFVLAFVFFVVVHNLPARPNLRKSFVATLGERPYIVLYSLISIFALGWLIVAAGRAPYVSLWEFEPWQLWVPIIAMLPACLLIALALGRPNPLSFGGSRNDEFDPQRPGVVALTRHPLLVALALWSAGHVIPNGNLAHVFLFGGFALISLFAMRGIDRRYQRQLGSEAWATLMRQVRDARVIDIGSAFTGPFLLRAAAGILFFLVLLLAHPYIIGVSPLPVH